MAYVGKFNHQLDQKNRLRIPAKLKAELGQNFAIVRGTSGCLFIYSEEQFANLYEEKSKNISFVTEEGKEATDALRRMVATMSIPEEDNQGRFVLDANLRRIAKIQKTSFSSECSTESNCGRQKPTTNASRILTTKNTISRLNPSENSDSDGREFQSRSGTP